MRILWQTEFKMKITKDDTEVRESYDARRLNKPKPQHITKTVAIKKRVDIGLIHTKNKLFTASNQSSKNSQKRKSIKK